MPEAGMKTFNKKTKKRKRKSAVVLMFLIRDKCVYHTLYSPIVGSVNNVTDVHKLAPIFSLNSSKCSLFCKEKALVLSLSYSRMKNVWSS